MYYLIYLSERCNLQCAYCETPSTREQLTQDVGYDLTALVDFLNQDPDLALWFFGGEPLLRIDLIEGLLARLRPRHVVLQTNGLLLDQLPVALLPELDLVAVSLDGPRQITDRGRGAGTYDAALRQAALLRQRGYAGRLDVRLTLNPAVDAAQAIGHFLGDCPFTFDGIHWQLNAPFHRSLWRDSRRQVRRWLGELYNPQITALVDRWAAALAEGRLVQLVPFARIMHTLLGAPATHRPRCGAGSAMWSISTDGRVFPCPVLRSYPRYSMGSFTDLTPATLRSPVALGEPCTACRLFDLCGGRCLYANLENPWDAEGFALVCGTVRHLIAELKRVQPIAEAALARGVATLDDFNRCQEYEVIP